MKVFLVVLLAVVGVALSNNEPVAPNTSDVAPDKTIPPPEQPSPAPDQTPPVPDKNPTDPNAPSNNSPVKSKFKFGTDAVKGGITIFEKIVKLGSKTVSNGASIAFNTGKNVSYHATTLGKDFINSSTSIADSALDVINEATKGIPVIGMLVGFGTNVANKSVHKAAQVGTAGLSLFNDFEDTKLSWMDRVAINGNNYVHNLAEKGAASGIGLIDSGVEKINNAMGGLFSWLQ